MARDGMIQVRVDMKLKKEADELFNDLGLDTASAVRLFLKQAVLNEGLPFAIRRFPKDRPQPEAAEAKTEPAAESEEAIINDLY